jgi:hypothetical protein
MIRANERTFRDTTTGDHQDHHGVIGTSSPACRIPPWHDLDESLNYNYRYNYRRIGGGVKNLGKGGNHGKEWVARER